MFDPVRVEGFLGLKLKYPLMEACVDLITSVIEVNFEALSLEEYLKAAKRE